MFYINNTGVYKTAVRNQQFYNNIIVQTVTPRAGSGIICSMATDEATPSIVVMKNNIFYVSNGKSVTRSAQFNSGQMVHTNNVYKIINGGAVNLTLDPTEVSTTTTIWSNTAATDPLTWDYSLTATSPANNKGTNLGISVDFSGRAVSNPPDAGILEYISTAPPLVAASTYSTIACGGGKATITVTATGGTPPYTGVGVFSTFAGYYSYTVTDFAGATSTTSGTITEPLPIVPNISIGSIACNGGSTTITIGATGGVPPYTGIGTYTISAGSYSYTITDANNCSKVVAGTVTQPDALSLGLDAGSITVNGGTTIITATAVGGTAPYSYKINNASYQTSNIFTRIPAGTYKVAVKDANGCTALARVSISQPGPLTKKSKLVFIEQK